MMMNKQIIYRFTSVVYAVTLIGIMNPFFFWNAYRGGIFSSNGFPVLKLLYVLSLVTGITSIIIEKRFDNQKMKMFRFTIICTLTFNFICGINHFDISNIAINSILNMFLVGMFCLFPESMKSDIYHKFMLYFILTIIPGILYSILTFAGMDFSFETLSAASEIKQNSYVTYLHMPFAVQISKSYDLLGNLNRFRLCGIYDEPGRVGTICAFFLVAENLSINKNWKTRVLFVGGILTLSLAFFLIIAIAFGFKLIHQRKVKYFGIFSISILVIIAFMNMNFNNVALNSLQNRLVFTSSGIVGDNRTDAAFNSFFDSYLENAGLFNILFGNGNGSIYRYATEHAIGASSYKCIIYDIGYGGLLLYIIWLIKYGRFYSMGKKIDWFIAINLIVFIMSLYQRPVIFNPSYLLIPLAGISSRCLDYVEE